MTGIRLDRNSPRATLRQHIDAAVECTWVCRVLLILGLPLGLWIASGYALDSVLASLAGLVGFPLGLAGGALYRHRRRARLRRALEDLTGRQLAEVFQDLTVERGDAAKLTAALRRDLRIPTELCPANRPAGRGDEPTP